jgi:hypothetical protein
MSRARKTYPSREVRCQMCTFRQRRRFGRGLLVKPCTECGSRVTFAVPMAGDQPVTPSPVRPISPGVPSHRSTREAQTELTVSGADKAFGGGRGRLGKSVATMRVRQ